MNNNGVKVDIIQLCLITCAVLTTCTKGANWKQNFQKNSTKYRSEREDCRSCSGNYGFQLDDECLEQDGTPANKCSSSYSDMSIDDCKVTEHKCKSGQCIDLDAVCNGRPDCFDSSDETEKECSKISCLTDSYTCRYGACINKSAKCNGIKDCFDGSDEEECGDVVERIIPTSEAPSIGQSPQPPGHSPQSPAAGSCIVPKPPPLGAFINNNNPKLTWKEGDYVPQFHALITSCENHYKTTPPTAKYPVCISGKWTSPPLGCARSCPTVTSTISTRIVCTYDRMLLDSCENPVEGTIATITCDPLYEGQSGNPSRVCRDGTWDYPIYECRPVCGQKIPKGKPNIIGGQKAVKGSYPWHVGIYANDARKSHLCGGSILSQHVIVSAAHCFTDHEGKLFPKEKYLIAAGKYFRQYEDAKDEYAQYATIHSIHVPDRFKGDIANYEADISVVILTKPLTISLAVQPVCVDWTTDFEYQQLSENNVGVVVGWGFTKKGDAPSEELNELTVPYVSYEQCYERVPRDFRKYLTYDKICAGFLYKGIAVCQGDSGGGLTFQRKFNDRYYIRGIVSTSPRSEESCDPDQFATYTLISRHIDFIRELETLYRV